jgi:hypothetical protein
MLYFGDGAPGVVIFSNYDTIGGTSTGAGNLISGNDDNGIDVNGGSGVGSGGLDEVFEGNLIGTDLVGTAVLPNTNGIVRFGATFNSTIGGTQAGAGNLISGNSVDGVDMTSGSKIIEGNLIGTDITGTESLGNQMGVEMSSGQNNRGRSSGRGRERHLEEHRRRRGRRHFPFEQPDRGELHRHGRQRQQPAG